MPTPEAGIYELLQVLNEIAQQLKRIADLSLREELRSVSRAEVVGRR